MAHILVVDDEQSILESLKLILTEQGFNVDTAPDAEAALGLLRKKSYDLILTDLLMPKVDGFEFIKTIRTQWGQRVPVIIITAHGTVEIASLALNEGVNDFIIKPFDIQTVSQAVRYALERKASSAAALLARPGTKTNIDEEFEKKFFGLSILDEISKKINSASEVEEIGGTLVDLVQQGLKPDRGLVVIYALSNNEIQFQRLFSLDQLTNIGPSAIDKGILEWVTKSGQPLLIEDMARDTQYRACFYGILSTGALLAVPLKRRTQIIGALILYKQAGSKPFQEDALKWLSILASMASTAIENAELYNELKNYFTGTIRALITTVEIKDPLSFGHSTRVARYTIMIGKQIQLTDMELRRLEYMSMLHDIGKIGIPETILNKNIPLTPEEWDLMKNHVKLGESIVRSIHFLPEGDKVIRYHHERFDGQGYPDQLEGEAIPLFARIIAIADAFDAMTSSRSYRTTLEPTEALEELLRCAGKQFDPDLTKVFVQAYKDLFHMN